MPTHVSQETRWINLNQIDIPADGRQHDPEKLKTLARDMKEQGQLQEIVVMPSSGSRPFSKEEPVPRNQQTRGTERGTRNSEDGVHNENNLLPSSASRAPRFEVVAGVGRTLAARSLGWDQIRASVRIGISEFDKARITFAENEDREDADPFYQAAELAKMLKAKGCSQQALADELGISEATVNAYQAVDKLPDEVKKLRRLSLGQLTQVARLKDSKKQIDLANRTVKEDLSVRQLKALVDKLLGKPDSSAEAARQRVVAKAGVQWHGKEIIINRHFRPVEESLTEYTAWLTKTLTPMLLAMPGLKDSPKSSKDLAAAIEKNAAKASAGAQTLVDQALNRMTPAQMDAFRKQVEAGNAQDDKENAAAADKVRAQMEKDLQ